MKDIKYDPVDGFDISVAKSQCGIDWDYIANAEKDTTKTKAEIDELYNTNWIGDLIDEGIRYARYLWNDDPRFEHSNELDLRAYPNEDDDYEVLYLEIWIN